MWNAKPAADGRLRPHGQPEQPAPEDDRLLDHHIEEVLATFGEASGEGECPDSPEQGGH